MRSFGIKKEIIIMNVANHITSYRIVAVFLFMILMSLHGLFFRYAALLLLIAAAISDLYDGKIARKMGNVTNFGKIMDPLADKILVSAALIFLVQKSVIPAWMVIIIISREFAVMGLRILASMEQKIIVADKYGKYKTAAQLISIIVIYVFMLFQKTMIHINNRTVEQILLQGGLLGKYVLIIFNNTPYFLMIVAVIITVISGANYFIQNKNLYMKEL